MVYTDRQAARRSIDRLLEWPFERVVLSHGNLIDRNAREAVRQAFTWL